MNLRVFMSAALVSLLVAGCTPVANLRQSDRAYKDTDDQAQKLIEQMRKPDRAAPRDTVVVTTTPWVDPRPIRSVERRIPNEVNCSVAFKPLVPTSVLQFAQQVSQDCHLPVRVTSDALQVLNGGSAESAATGSATSASSRLTGLPALPALPSTTGGGSLLQPSYTGAPNMLTDIDWRGPLAGLLDLVTARLGLSWRWNDSNQSISIFYVDTRTFRLDAFPTRTNMQSSIQTGMATSAGISSAGTSSSGSSGGGVGGAAGSSQSSSTTMESDLYKDIGESIKSLLTPSTGRMALSGATGTVTVTDTPEVLDRVGAMLSRENAMLRKQIIFHTKILAITLSQSDDAGINWDVVYKTLSGKYGLTFSTDYTAASGAGSLGASITSGRLADSSAILSALSELGKVTTVTSPSAVTLNLRPVPVQIARQFGYVAKTELNTTSNSGTTSSMETGYVTVGFSMNLVPRMMEDDREITLRYEFNISALNEIRSVTSGDTTIEMPDIDTRLFNGEVGLRTGQTLILHGFEQDQHDGSRSGVGSPFAWMVGGNASITRKKTAIVILITPEIVNSAAVSAQRVRDSHRVAMSWRGMNWRGYGRRRGVADQAHIVEARARS